MTTKQKILFIAIVIAVLVVAYLIPSIPSKPCAVSEFAPDVPVHIKEQCRQHRRIKT